MQVPAPGGIEATPIKPSVTPYQFIRSGHMTDGSDRVQSYVNACAAWMDSRAGFEICPRENRHLLVYRSASQSLSTIWRKEKRDLRAFAGSDIAATTPHMAEEVSSFQVGLGVNSAEPAVPLSVIQQSLEPLILLSPARPP
jgi:hypothetical protein